MQRDFGVTFVTQCAPVMAGLKPANLFRWVELDASAMEALVCHWHTLLRPRGLAVEILSRDTANHAFLVYVYRAPRLQAIFKAPEICTYLSEVGYPQPEDFRAALQHLSARLAQGGAFPHEIGIFLGYPLEDVVGFVRNKGKNYTFKGYWKAYGDPAAAQARFASFRKCTDVYLRCYRNGTPVTRLTVAV